MALVPRRTNGEPGLRIAPSGYKLRRQANGDSIMTTFGIVYLALLLSATVGCILWWLQRLLGAEAVRAILTVLLAVGWPVFGYLMF
jgi:hypothetical protein